MRVEEMVGGYHLLNGPVFAELLGVLMDREAWHDVVHGVAKSRTRLSD